MTNKPKKTIDREWEEFCKFKAECLRRNLDFWKDMQKLRDCFLHIRSKVKNSTNELKRIRKEIHGKFNVWVKYPLDYEDIERLTDLFDIYPIRVIPHRSKIIIPKGRLTKIKFMQSNRSEVRWLNLIKKRPEEDIKHILRDNRYVTLEIDTHRNIGIIKRYIENYINDLKKEKERYGLEVRWQASPHLQKYKRYFAVWDLVQKRKEIWPYSRIVDKLKEDGWYKKQTLKQAILLARQDYRTACRAIGVSVKDKKNTSKKVMRPIISNKIKGAKAQKVLFEEWEGRLAAYNLGLDEYIPKKLEDRGIDKFRHNPTDGPTKQKLKSSQKIEEDVVKRLHNKRKENLRKLLK